MNLNNMSHYAVYFITEFFISMQVAVFAMILALINFLTLVSISYNNLFSICSKNTILCNSHGVTSTTVHTVTISLGNEWTTKTPINAVWHQNER